MNRNLFWLFTAILLASLHRAGAQQAKKVYRIGYLSNTDPATESTRSTGFRLALRELAKHIGLNIPQSVLYRANRVIK